MFIELSDGEIDVIRTLLGANYLCMNTKSKWAVKPPPDYEKLFKKMNSIINIKCEPIYKKNENEILCLGNDSIPWTYEWFNATKHCCCVYCKGGWYEKTLNKKRKRDCTTSINGFTIE